MSPVHLERRPFALVMVCSHISQLNCSGRQIVDFRLVPGHSHNLKPDNFQECNRY